MGAASLLHSPARDPPGCWLLGPQAYRLDPWHSARHSGRPLEPQTSEEPLLLASYLDEGGVGQAQFHRTLLWPPLSLLSFTTPPALWLVSHRAPSRLDLSRLHHRWPRCSARGPS